MFEIKKGKTQFVPVRMINVGGDGQTGINYTDVTASLLLANNSIVNLGISASAWFEASGSNVFAGMGVYSLQIHSASITSTGSFLYAVSAGPNVPAVKYVGALRVSEIEKSDIFTRIGLPVSNDLSTDIQNLSSSLIITSGNLGREIQRLRVVSEGRWKIDPATNKMTFYTIADPTVPFMVLGLTGSDGTPTVTNPYERRPTS